MALRRACLLAALLASAVGAQSTSFDLVGPSLKVTVTHGGATLPLSQVPNLAAGDRLHVAAELPPSQGSRYRLVLAFLRGATNPPPKDWLFSTETWKPGQGSIDAAVPDGAGQAVLLLVPEAHGTLDAAASAIRGKPGAFVRATQELSQAGLDRARLAAFVDGITHRDPAELAGISPQLAKSLAVKLDTDCLQRQPDARAACLTQGSNAAVLADGQTSSIAQTLAGAPADIALGLSATPQAGFGYYSPYIGVIRDVARLLGAFQSAQLQFIPALSVAQGDATGLMLNAVPSFRKPQSVLVAALPNVAPPALPPLAAGTEAPLCLARPGLVLPVTGAPLVFATSYARNMRLRVGTADLPVTADPARGGYLLGAAADAAGGKGVLHGQWGFTPFDGPSFTLVSPAEKTWQAAGDASLVVGRETPLKLTGGAAACVSAVTIERGGVAVPVTWSADGADGLALKVPLADAAPGPVTISVRSDGVAEPQRLQLRAYAEAGHITGFTLHAGDREGVLTGTRLDQVASLTMGGVTFRPGALARVGQGDRLPMTTDAAAVGALQPGQTREAEVTLADGRHQSLRVTLAPPRPAATLLARSVTPGPATRFRLATGEDLLPADARLTFSVRADHGKLNAADRIEVDPGDTGQVASLPIRLQDAAIGIAELDPAALGPSAHGPLRYRLVQDGVAGDWRPLVTLVRLPAITAVTCAPGAATCRLEGTGLFLLRAVGGNGTPASVPDGFTGASLEVPRPAGGHLTLTPRDAPEASVTLAVTG